MKTGRSLLIGLAIASMAGTAGAQCAVGPGPNTVVVPSTQQSLGIAVTSPPNGTLVPIPPGTQLVTANCAINKPPGQPINVLYVVDVSGSTDLTQSAGLVGYVDANGNGIGSLATPDPGDDFNGDGQAGETLDGEIAGVLALNASISTGSPANVRVGVVAFATNASAGDVRPAPPNSTIPIPGTQVFTAPPNADDNANLKPDIEEVLRSLRSEPSSASNNNGKIGLFTPVTTTLGRNTNFVAALNAMNAALANFPTGTNLVFFLSDGFPNTGGLCTSGSCNAALNTAVAAGTRIHTVAVGSGASDTELQVISGYAGIGGTHTHVTNPSTLSTVLPAITPQGIAGVTLDGVPVPIDAVGNFSTVVPCPAGSPPSAFAVPATCTANDPAATTVTACLTLTCYRLCGDGQVNAGIGEECEPPNTATCDGDCQRVPNCGDGFVDTPETCDPPDGVTCNATCQLIQCGDGNVDPPAEECEPPNTGTCDADCQRRPSCGDGFVDAPEECEPPGQGSCDTDCTDIVCGNGDVEAGEECEPPNTATCDGTCQRVPACGDGFVDAPELCDPPDQATCDTDCTPIVCGNGDLEPGEECDGSAFGAFCAPQPCVCGPDCERIPLSGDGQLDQGESCDPPNTPNCDANCELIACGNGIVQPGEECDPPNGVLCDEDCQRFPFCGDTFVDDPEDCDPPNGTTCDSDCTLIECGNGQVEVDEECDPPNGVTCDAQCQRIPICGDDFIDAPEQCEPPSTNNCDAACFLIECGNGIVQPGEECDPPAGQTCDEDCQRFPICGDGFLDFPEQCEPPNTPTCSAGCSLEEVCVGGLDEDGDGLVDCQDPDCDCPPVQKDPAKIRFGTPGAKADAFKAHGSFATSGENVTFDPATQSVTVRLTTKTAVVFQGTIPVASMSGLPGDSRFKFKDKTTGQADGIRKMKIQRRKGLWVFSILAYGDLSAANDAEMTLGMTIGDQGFRLQRRWERRSWGWFLRTDNFGNP